MLLITPLIKDWCYQHELEQCSPDYQVMKIHEEMGELSSALLKHDKEAIIDAIGDVYIALTVLSEQIHIDVEERLMDFQNHYYRMYHEVSKFMVEVFYPKMENLTFAVTMPNSYGKTVKDKHINDIVSALQYLSIMINLNFNDCVKTAFNEVKNRSQTRVYRNFKTLDYQL